MRGGDLKACYRWIERAVEADPEDAMSYNHLAGWHLGQGNVAAAEAAMREALKRAPTHPALLRRISEIAQRRGQLTEAADWAEQGLAVQPLEVGLLNQLAGVRIQQGDLYGAAKAVEKALTVAPDNPAMVRRAEYLAAVTA